MAHETYGRTSATAVCEAWRMAPHHEVVDLRTLNRTMLRRQWLDRRRRAGAVEAVRHLVGLNAQAPELPVPALGAAPAEIAERTRQLLADGSARTRPALGRELGRWWPEAVPNALGWTAQCLVAMVHPTDAAW